MILETRGLIKTFGKLAAVQNISFGVEEGEIFGIAGPNGAGKSTLFNMIAGFYPPTAGSILFKDEDITRLSADKVCRKGIARTFQIPTTFYTLNVYDNIRIGATFGKTSHDHKLLHNWIEEIVSLLGLEEKTTHSATNLDLYTTKVVLLGAALATDCKLLMLDEPMAGFTMVEIENYLALIRKLREEKNITVIIIEHLLDILIDVSDRMMIVNNGEILYVGNPEKVTEDSRVIDVYLGGKHYKGGHDVGD
jgi:branched-chain amino acid transport system ATP-binding protein